MAKLGYTFYSKDWKTDEKVFNLTLELRGLYREFIDFAYENDNQFTVEHRYWCRMLGINKRKFDTLFVRLINDGLIVLISDKYYIPSVEKRISKIRSGKLGGEKSKQTPKQKPKQKANQREREIERETKRESSSLKKLPFFKEAFNCYCEVLKYFPEHLHPKTDKIKNTWLDTIEKLHRIDKIPFSKIEEIVKKTREDSFWSNHFLSVGKLRKKNNDGIMYIVVFNEKIKKKPKSQDAMEILLNQLP